MLSRFVAFFAALMLTGAAAPAAVPNAALRASLQRDLSQYLAARAKPEHISAISLSVSFPGDPANLNVTAGTTRYGGGSPVTRQSLYQIGSNTKSFTAVALLQLEAAGKLSIDDTVGKWLPQYPAWKTVTIRHLLDMTSGIPTYDGEQAMLAAYAANPNKDWTPAQLIAFVYPKRNANAGWLYSNTAYLLGQLIIERATGASYASEIRRRFLRNSALGLTDAYYEPNRYPAPIADRLVSGYFFSKDPDNAGLRPLFGKDVRTMSLSWAQGAGGIVATPQDVTRWSRALFSGPLLPQKQRAELTTLVSQTTSEPIAGASPAHPRAFGLGVAQLWEPKMGRFWFYEGETLGYRMAFAYLPKSRVVFAVGLNSQPDKAQDKIGALMQSIYTSLHAAGKV